MGHSTNMSVRGPAICAAPHWKDVEAVSLLAKSHNEKARDVWSTESQAPPPHLSSQACSRQCGMTHWWCAQHRPGHRETLPALMLYALAQQTPVFSAFTGSLELKTSDVTTTPPRSSPLHHPHPPGPLQKKNIRQTGQSAFSLAQVHR